MKLKQQIPAVIGLLLFVFSAVVSAQGADLAVTLTPDRSSYAPGDTVVFGIHVVIPDGFHFYSNPLGPGIGLPTEISVNQSPELHFFAALKSPPKKFMPQIGGWVWAYEKEAFFFVKAVAGPTSASSITDTITLSGLMCKASCIKVSKDVLFTLSFGPKSAAPLYGGDRRFVLAAAAAESMDLDTGSVEALYNEEVAAVSLEDLAAKSEAVETEIPAWTYTPAAASKGIGIFLALLFAFIAGVILNVMPCVLPILGIKALAIAQGHTSRKRAITGSIAFTLGMLAVFMGLASLAAFAGFSWGQQFQDPKFLVGIVCFIFFFALGMFDLYMILVPAKIGAAAQSSGGKGIWSDALSGVFATVLATPCSGPFLGATLAWTLTQPAVVIYLVFLALGLGMASPYILLSLIPGFARLMPKPGEWMNDFKRIMGFMLIGFAVWLMIGIPRDMVVSTVGLCAVIALVVVLYGRVAPFGSSLVRHILSFIAACVVFAAGVYLCFGVLFAQTSDEAFGRSLENGAAWETFSAKALFDANEMNRNVIVDFTANWCMNCQYNMIAVLSAPEVKALVEKKNVLPLVADLTKRQPVAESLLHHLGSRSVPFFAIFPANDPQHPIILRDILNKGQLIRILNALPD